jgi:hypothetical protein
LIDAKPGCGYVAMMSVTLDFDEQVLASLPLGPGERGIPRQYGMIEALEDVAHARRR